MNEQTASSPWWRYGYVWLLIAGPVAVILASMVTIYLALRSPDPAIDDYYRKGMEINKTLAIEANSLAPAIEARNHAQTGLAEENPQK
jgi:hypothetical protein